MDDFSNFNELEKRAEKSGLTPDEYILKWLDEKTQEDMEKVLRNSSFKVHSCV